MASYEHNFHYYRFNYSWKIGTDWFYFLLKSYLTCVTVYCSYNVCLNKYRSNNRVIMFVQNTQKIITLNSF